jgi:calcium/calmodulin-dependent protein kinase I
LYIDSAADLFIWLPVGHGKPVDIWAMGVITYFLLAGMFRAHQLFTLDVSSLHVHTGYTPFDRESHLQEREAIIAGDYKFEPGTFPS